MEFLPLSRRRSSAQNVPSDEERGETDVFAGYKASTSYGYFHYVSYGIFAHWFSLDQMFKFSVSFATEVEKKTDHRMDVLIEVFAPQKTQREQQITYMT